MWGVPPTGPTPTGTCPRRSRTFQHDGTSVTITEFADRLVVGGHAFVAVYSRVAIENRTAHTIAADPQPAAGLIPLNNPPVLVQSHSKTTHDYVITVDRFGNRYAWPSRAALIAAGGYDVHFAHMRSFWDAQLDQVGEH